MRRRGTSTDEAQFTAFVHQATPSLMRTAYLLTGSTDAAHELVQAALVKTYLSWTRVRHDEALAYARRVLVNHNTDTWRRRRGEHLVPDVPDTPRRQGNDVDDRDELRRLLAALPAQQRRVVVLRYYNDLSEQATAELLGISVGAVKSAASRGLASLRAARHAIARASAPVELPGAERTRS